MENKALMGAMDSTGPPILHVYILQLVKHTHTSMQE